MANPFGDAGSGLRLDRPDGASTIKLENLEKIPLADKKGGGTKDPLADLAKEAKRARRNAQAGGIVITPGGAGATGLSFGITEAGGVALVQTNAARLLAEAKAHLSRGECGAALEKVSELLREHPGHAEGLFLKAACHYGLAEPRAGLRALAELRAVKEGGGEVTKLVWSGAHDLRLKLRAAILPGTLQENHDRLKEGQWEAVIEDTDELIGLDADVWEFHYLRADGLSQGDRQEGAWEGVARALALAAPKRPEALANLEETVRGRIAQHLMAPALTLFKEGKYAKARAAVAGIDPEFRAAKVAGLFDAYLALLDTVPPGTPETVPPPGPLADADALNFFLTRDDVPLMKAMRAAGAFDLAETKGRDGLKVAPHFPYLRFLMALTLYDGTVTRFGTEQSPTLDEAETAITEAREHAQLALADAELNAESLVAALDRLLVVIAEAREEERRWDLDFVHLQPLADGYIGLMETVKNGLDGLAHHDRMTRGMRDIERRVGPLKGTMQSRGGADLLDRIDGAVQNVLRQLVEIRDAIAEGEELNKLWKRLSDQLDRVKGGYVTQYTIYSLRTELNSILSAAQALRPRLTVPDVKNACTELINTVRDIQSKIGG